MKPFIRLGSLSGLSTGLKNQRMLVRHQSQAPFYKLEVIYMQQQYEVLLEISGEYQDFASLRVSESELEVVRKVCDAIETDSQHTAVRIYSTKEI